MPIQTEHGLTPDYFREELLRFRDVMGNAAIMRDQEKRDRAFKGFTLVYLQVEGTAAEVQEVAKLFQSTSEEFSRRCTMIDLHAIRQAVRR